MNRKMSLYLADGSLLMVAAVWGLTFVTVKNAIAIFSPLNFNFYRFGLAAFIMLMFALPKRRQLSRTVVRDGILVGVFLFGGYSLQTLGLLYTTASNAGFITGLSVVFVPVIATMITRKRPGPGVIGGVICAAAGLFLLSANELKRFNAGDILVMFCAVSFALHIIFVGRYASRHSTVWLVSLQIATVAILSGITSFIFEGGIQKLTVEVLSALAITAVFATCAAFFTQNYMQRFTSPSHTAIIFTSEPVFAAFFAVLLLHEKLSVHAYWGGAIILMGMLLSELKTLPGKKRVCVDQTAEN